MTDLTPLLFHVRSSGFTTTNRLTLNTQFCFPTPRSFGFIFVFFFGILCYGKAFQPSTQTLVQHVPCPPRSLTSPYITGHGPVVVRAQRYAPYETDTPFCPTIDTILTTNTGKTAAEVYNTCRSLLLYDTTTLLRIRDTPRGNFTYRHSFGTRNFTILGLDGYICITVLFLIGATLGFGRHPLLFQTYGCFRGHYTRYPRFSIEPNCIATVVYGIFVCLRTWNGNELSSRLVYTQGRGGKKVFEEMHMHRTGVIIMSAL